MIPYYESDLIFGGYAKGDGFTVKVLNMPAAN